MSEFKLSLETKFAIALFNLNIEKLTREEAIQRLKSNNENAVLTINSEESIESKFAISSFNQAADELDRDGAIGLLKQLNEVAIATESLMKFLLADPIRDRSTGLEHISKIIPRVVDCGDNHES